jgi:hypothetical protein
MRQFISTLSDIFWLGTNQREPRPLPTPEVWAMQNADICNADQIIAAKIVEQFAKNPRAWTFTCYYELPALQRVPRGCSMPNYDSNHREFTVRGKGMNIKGTWTEKRFYYNREFGTHTVEFGKLMVNELVLAPECCEFVYHNCLSIHNKHQAALKAAAAAKEAMENEQKKWDFAEKVLGFKRDEKGALVPINTVIDGSI